MVVSTFARLIVLYSTHAKHHNPFVLMMFPAAVFLAAAVVNVGAALWEFPSLPLSEADVPAVVFGVVLLIAARTHTRGAVAAAAAGSPFTASTCSRAPWLAYRSTAWFSCSLRCCSLRVLCSPGTRAVLAAVGFVVSLFEIRPAGPVVPPGLLFPAASQQLAGRRAGVPLWLRHVVLLPPQPSRASSRQRGGTSESNAASRESGQDDAGNASRVHRATITRACRQGCGTSFRRRNCRVRCGLTAHARKATRRERERKQQHLVHTASRRQVGRRAACWPSCAIVDVTVKTRRSSSSFAAARLHTVLLEGDIAVRLRQTSGLPHKKSSVRRTLRPRARHASATADVRA